MAEQDEQLDRVLHSVINMREMAGHIGFELEDQTTMLESLDQRVDDTQSRLQRTIKRVDHLLAVNGGILHPLFFFVFVTKSAKMTIDAHINTYILFTS